MTLFDRFHVGVAAAGLGVIGFAAALAPAAAAAPLLTGGSACLQTAAGQVGAAEPMAGCGLASAPVADMAAGVPMALPGPIPIVPAAPVVPVVPGLPVAPIVPLAPIAPAAAPVVPAAAGAPIVEMAGDFGGKGDPVTAPAPGAPAPGQPILPGPAR